MKDYILFTLLFALGFTIFAQAQPTNKTSQSVSVVTIPRPNDAKTTYIQNQNYLYSATLSKNYDNPQIDSLVGFNEESVRLDLLSRNFSGSEYLVLMNNLKRNFIYTKYKIGPKALSSAQSRQMAGKPIGSGNSINVAPCVNEDFELTPPGAYPNNASAVTGWTIDSGQNGFMNSSQNGFNGIACFPNGVWVSGSPEFSIVSTPIIAAPAQPCNPFLWSINDVNVPNSPLGGTNVARLNDSQPGTQITRLRSNFPVTSANSLFQFAYCGSWDGSGHACCDQPFFTVRLYDCVDSLLTCSTVSLIPSGPSCISGVPGDSVTCGISWTNWVVKYFDLTPYLGSCVTVEVINSDCAGGAHHGTAYFDARCGGALIGSGLDGNGGNVGRPISFCAGSNIAQIQAPLGYVSYQWYDPSYNAISPLNGGNTPIVTVSPATVGDVYRVELVSASGCTYTVLDTLAYSQVSIIGLGTTSTCAGGASGSATVQGNGSGAGYTYTWTNSANLVVGTNSVVSNIPAGVYNVTVSASCGSSTASVKVGFTAPTTYTVVKPFCSSQAYLSVSGTNIQWYNGLAPISASLGGTASGYTVANASNGQQIWVSYLSNQGCQDSILFLLNQTPSGTVYSDSTSFACQNQSNATATIVMTPSSGAAVGLNSYSVFSSAGFPNSIYTASLFPTASNTFITTGLAAGSYSIKAFDGTCVYTNTFAVAQYVFDYTVAPVTSTICSNISLLAGISFSYPIAPGEYSFLWTPNQYMQPSNTNTSVILSPTTALGTTSTFVYSVTVLPAIASCPVTKTISVTAVNLLTPTITSIPVFCNNEGSKTITVTPSGGTFSSGGGSINWLGATSGVITPSLTSIGTNTFMYSRSVGTCVASAVDSFNVSQFNTASLTSTVLNLCVGPCVSLMNIVQNTLGFWSGANVINNTFCPSIIPTNTYLVTYYNPSSPNPLLCPDSQTLVVTVNPLPTITVNSGTICSGDSFTIIPNGATNYTYSSGSNIISPITSTAVTIVGASAQGCVSSNTVTSSITVNPLPHVIASTSSSIICSGETATLTANGASTYTWNGGATTSVISVSPSLTTVYSIIGTDINGCDNSVSITQSVSACTGIGSEIFNQAKQINVYPNPNKGEFVISGKQETTFLMVDALGQVIKTISLNTTNHYSESISGLANGMYFLVDKNDLAASVKYKIIVIQ